MLDEKNNLSKEQLQKVTGGTIQVYHIIIEGAECINCGNCEGYCPQGAIHLEYTAIIDKSKCIDCGICLDTCPVGAIHEV